MGKLTLIVFLSLPAWGLNPLTFHYDFHQKIDDVAKGKNFSQYMPGIQDAPPTQFNYTKNDPEQIINDIFKIDSFLEPFVRFWFNIYTQYTSHHIIIHDSNDLGIVYDVLDLTSLAKGPLDKNTKYLLKKNFVRSSTNHIKKLLKSASEGTFNKEVSVLINKLKSQNITIPKDKKKARLFFKQLRKNIRSQTGQKDFIQLGILEFNRFYRTMKKYTTILNIPEELLYLPFVESSFNYKAQSKVDALGPWQFIKSTGKHFMTISRTVDHRLNVLLSTISALQLLKQNKMILKSWDLAIAAYNIGTSNIQKSIKKSGSHNINDLIANTRSKSIQFASKNFYAEFLAITYALKYSRHFYKSPVKETSDRHNLYLTLCPTNFKRFIDLLKKNQPRIRVLNGHIKNYNSIIPRGSVVVSQRSLHRGKYYNVREELLKKSRVKNLKKNIKNYSCSTK